MSIYIVYKTTNLINGRYYIGKHKTSNLNDNYLGSGTIIKEAIKSYGAENFHREIIAIYDNELDAFNKEAELVTEELVNDPLSYNLSTGGQGGRTHSKQSKDQMSKNMKGRTPWNKGKMIWSEEDRKRIGEQTRARGPQSEETIANRVEKNTGKKRTKEQRERMKEASLARNYTHNEETKAKMSAAKKGKPTGRKGHPNRKSLCSKWRLYNNDVDIVVDDLKQWCKNNEISYGAITNARYKGKSHKGWNLIRI